MEHYLTYYIDDQGKNPDDQTESAEIDDVLVASYDIAVSYIFICYL